MRLQLAALSLAGAALGLRASAASGSKPSRRPQSPTNVTVWGPTPSSAKLPSSPILADTPTFEATILADTLTHELNPLSMGCHSDSGYNHQPRGFYAQLVVGESFEADHDRDAKWVTIVEGAGIQGSASPDTTDSFHGTSLPTPRNTQQTCATAFANRMG